MTSKISTSIDSEYGPVTPEFAVFVTQRSDRSSGMGHQIIHNRIGARFATLRAIST